MIPARFQALKAAFCKPRASGDDPSSGLIIAFCAR